MSFLYPSLIALGILTVFTFFIGRQNRDLLRVKAYREFLWRLIPPVSTGVFVFGLPFVMSATTPYNDEAVLLIYVSGAAVLTVIMARNVAPEERRAGRAFRREDYDKAVELYEDLVEQRPLPRYFAALGASLDATGDPHSALDAAERAVKLDPHHGIAYYNRASALAALGEKTRARRDLQTVFQVDASRNLRRAAAEALDMLEKS
ncbi:MAG: tetratricopeptide repeat protein [Rubrobacteraceae bacterium]